MCLSETQWPLLRPFEAIYLTFDLEGWPWPFITQNVQLYEIHMHAKYQVAIFNISKDMTKVKVSTTLWSHIFDQVVIFNIKKVIHYCKSLTKVKVFNRMTDRQAKYNIPQILRSEHNNPLLNLNEFQTHKVQDIIFTWLNVAVVS